MKAVIIAFFSFCLVVQVLSGCTGNPKTFNGLPCATTTRYWDNQEGACGCGSGSGPFSWATSHTAAASQALYDSGGSSWCGAGCGACYEITPTGDCTEPASGCASSTSPVTIMISNLCPYSGNEKWCPNPGNTNQYGYSYHFDLIDPNLNAWVESLGWNNPVVTLKRVPCGGGGSPNCSSVTQCSQCSGLPSACSTSGSATSTSTSTHATTASTSTHATTASTSTSTSTHATSTSTSTHATTASTATSTSTHATTASTAASTSTHSTSTSTSSSTGTSGCHATVSATLSSSYSGGGQVAITVKNTGTSAIHAVDLAISGSPSVFNLVSLSAGNYNLASYAFPLNAGSSFTGAGFSFTGSQPSVSLSSVTC